MIIRFITVCVALTFIFVMAVPVMQIGVLFQGKGGGVQDIASAAPQENEDAFAKFASDETSDADALNAIAPAAGAQAEAGIDDGFGAPFAYIEPQAFIDETVPAPEEDGGSFKLDL